MDRKTIFAFLLIALVIIFYPVYMQKLTGDKKSPVQKPAETQKETPITPTQAPLPAPELLKEKPTAAIAALDTIGAEKIIVVETPLYSAKFSSKGGSLIYFHLKRYKDYKDRFVKLTEEGEAATADLTVTAPSQQASAAPAMAQEPTGELHQIDRSKPIAQIIAVVTVIAISVAGGFLLIRSRA